MIRVVLWLPVSLSLLSSCLTLAPLTAGATPFKWRRNSFYDFRGGEAWIYVAGAAGSSSSCSDEEAAESSAVSTPAFFSSSPSLSPSSSPWNVAMKKEMEDGDKDKKKDIDEDVETQIRRTSGDDEKEESSKVFLKGEEDTIAERTMVEEDMLVDDPEIDEDSSGNVDHMEYADAYDDTNEDEDDKDNHGDDDNDDDSDEKDDGKINENNNGVAIEKITTLSKPMMDHDGGNAEVYFDSQPTIELATEITDHMKQVLRNELKYRAGEVKMLRPEIASILVAKKVQRPGEGLPPHWYKSNEGTKDRGVTTAATSTTTLKSKLSLRKKLIYSLVGCALGFVAAFATKEMGLVVSFVPSRLFNFRLSSPQEKSSLAKPKQLDEISADALFEVLPEQDDEFEARGDLRTNTNKPLTSSNDHYYEQQQQQQEQHKSIDNIYQHEHSVRPGESYPKEPIDVTWLDKFITAVEKRLKKLFVL